MSGHERQQPAPTGDPVPGRGEDDTFPHHPGTSADFIALMSHELKTPLNVILGYMDLLASGVPEPLPAAARLQVERARASAVHLLDVIDSLLSYARLRSGDERIHVRPVDLAPVLRETAAAVRPLAEDKALAFEARVPQELGQIETDVTKVGQIVFRLLSNAIKFTQTGRVELEAGPDGAGGIEIRVDDTGPGIEEADRDRIFEPFWQRDHGLTRRAGGSGLGLTVALELTKLLGGRLDLESEAGKGSTFTLRLPATAAGSGGETEAKS